MGGQGSGGARQQRKKAITLLIEAADLHLPKERAETHRRIMRLWLGVLGDPDHQHYLGCLKEYNRYILGVPVQQHEMEITSQLTTTITPEMLLAAGVLSTQVEVEDEAGNITTKTIVAGLTPADEDGPAGD